MRVLLLYTVALGGLLAVVSCAQRIGFDQPIPQPVVDSVTVRITPTWNVAQRPARVNALFYTPAGVLAKEVQLPVDGGEVTLVKDTYRVILCNPDADRVVFGQMDQLAGAMARVTAVSKSGQGIENPGSLFSTAFELPLGTVEAQQLMVLRTMGVTIQLKAEDYSLAQALAVSVRLRNVADGINLSTGKAYHTTQSDFTVLAMQRAGVVNQNYSFTGSVFGCCVQPGCNNTAGHEVYADIDVTAPDGSVKTISADISTALKTAQESITTVSIDITVTQLALSAVVTGWTAGSASGSITGEVR